LLRSVGTYVSRTQPLGLGLAVRPASRQNAALQGSSGAIMVRREACCARLLALVISWVAMTGAVAQEAPQQPAVRLQEEAQSLYEGGRYQAGIDVAKRAVASREEALGPEHPAVAVSLQTLGQLHLAAGHYGLAQSIHQRALALCEKVLGPEHPQTASALVGLADAYSKADNFSMAEPLYQRARAILEKVRGAEHIETSAALLGLATLHAETAAHERAQPLFERALAIRKRVSGEESADVAAVLNGMGNLRFYIGAYAQAKTLYARALAIREKVSGREHPETARVLVNLALISTEMADYSEAEVVLKRALAIQEKTLGSEHPGTGRTLQLLATVYIDTGAYSQAAVLLLRVISVQRSGQSAAQGDLALSLVTLALVHSDMGRYAQAEPLCKEALAIAERIFGARHRYTLKTINTLGDVYRRMGHYNRAESLYKRVIALRQTVLGLDDRETAGSLVSLARLYADTGAYRKAQPLYRRAIALFNKAYGAAHPESTGALKSLAVLHWALGDTQQTLVLLQRIQDIQTQNSDRFLTTGSEVRKQDYLRKTTENTFDDVSFEMATSGTAATALGLTSVLRHKGRVLDAMSDNVVRLRRSVASADRALLEQLSDVAGQLSALTFGQRERPSIEQYRERVTQLTVRQEQLETELASRSRAFARELTPVTLANVQRAIPANAVLVEWFRYTPCGPKRKSFAPDRGPPRYVAYVLKRSGEPVAVDMGEAQVIERLARQLRVALANPASMDIKQRAAALSTKLLAPLRVHLRGAEHILFSPDGELNLVPMAALLDESGAYLTERFNLSYLTSGRDLLRLTTDPASASNAVVMADPDYGKRGPQPLTTPALKPQRSPDLDRGGLAFRSLAGTALEARDLTALLRLDPAYVLLGAEATETKLKRLKAPRILHIASHGFFLSDQQLSDELSQRRGLAPFAPNENPLLRSGLALAGANARSSGTDDGILTALEATQLDLSGTELVVLSACDSGIGQVQNGEGVYGLRRALALAGAQTQVTSLWKVSDAATRSLMVDYYRRLLQGEGRAAALRSAQRAMLASDSFSHPYYWASFIPIGNWNSLAALRRN
jgi:CHAT domain-containing protein/tetratricopeptide (TPR) repeat protein